MTSHIYDELVHLENNKYPYGTRSRLRSLQGERANIWHYWAIMQSVMLVYVGRGPAPYYGGPWLILNVNLCESQVGLSFDRRLVAPWPYQDHWSVHVP